MLELEKDQSENLASFRRQIRDHVSKSFFTKERPLKKTVVAGGRLCLLVTLYSTKKG
jgi:hypothetical protein